MANIKFWGSLILHIFVKNRFLKKYLTLYQPFLVFLFKFFITYAILGFIYLGYLSQFDSSKNETDSFTELVTNQTVRVIQFFGYECEATPHQTEASFKMYVNKKYVARVVEGCNAISVIILFIAFIVAFKGNYWKATIFILGGCLLIHFLNIVRIALICIALLHYPEHQHLLHGVLFPLFIYGIVFLLWFIWVTKLSVYAAKSV